MHIDLKLGLSCNNACIHCVMEPVRQRLVHQGDIVDTAQASLEALFRRIMESDVDSITLTGGEPTLRKDFFVILDELCRQGKQVTVQTNGRLLSRPDNAGRLKNINPENVIFVVALHGSQAAIHDGITCRTGSFAETVAAIKILSGLGFKTCGKIVLSNLNLTNLQAALIFMAQLKMDEVYVAFPHAQDFDAKTFAKVVPTYKSVREGLASLQLPDWFEGKIFWETIPFCQMPGAEFYRGSVDLLLLRERLLDSKTNIEMSMTGETIDWAKARLAIKSKLPACQSCLLDYICEGVWSEYLQLYSENEFKPIRDKSVALNLASLL